MILRELQIGDKFFAASDKKKVKKFQKIRNCVFNKGHGTSTCMCFDIKNKVLHNKSCNLEVTKE